MDAYEQEQADKEAHRKYAMRIEDFAAQLEPLDGAPVLKWAVPMDHLSATSLSMYLRCPEQFRHRYIKGEKRKPGEALVLGRSVHMTMERNFTQKIESHLDLAVADLVEFFEDEALQKCAEEEESYTGMEIEWDSQDEARKRGSKMIQHYQANVSPRLQPIGAETEFRLPGIAPVPLIGYLDLEVEAVGVDLKTAKQLRRNVKPDWQLQARLYSYARQKPIDYHVLAHTGTLTPLEEPALSISPSEAEIGAFVSLVKDTAERIERDYLKYGPDETWPTLGTINEMYNKAICAWCGWRSICPAGGEM